ncbi:hypothetical protein SLNSH_14750 [Alsobacter soli]|uniref:DUF1236 domain-containing protein n=1 Tax=Alsobacter soli TaxID=2109933 RepID=A0A2T1HRH7_9HYPH|nr:DUF1236 domain-containing protein [Alsobacter soli]PSC04250.1 hypothetical protein SLNSH_14750 [Alsobacter soli]
MRKLLLTSAAAVALALAAGASQAQTGGAGSPLQPGASGGSSSGGSAGARSGSDMGGKGEAQRATESSSGAARSSEVAPARSGADASGKAAADESTSTHGKGARSAESPSAKSGAEAPRGTAQGEQPHGKATAESAQGGKGEAQRPARAETQQAPSKSGTAAAEPSSKSGTAATEQQGSRSQSSASQERPGATIQSRSSEASGKAGNLSTGSINAAAKLSGEQRTKVTSTFFEHAKPAERVSFNVSVGTTVTDEVHLYPVPETIVSIVPQYRGYDYFVVRDEVVIVEPRTKKIVEVIHKSGGKGASINIRQDKVGLIKRELKPRQTIRKEVTIEEGAVVPEDIELEIVPETVISEVPEVRTYRYFRQGDEVVLVDPSSRRIVDVIE